MNRRLSIYALTPEGRVNVSRHSLQQRQRDRIVARATSYSVRVGNKFHAAGTTLAEAEARRSELQVAVHAGVPHTVLSGALDAFVAAKERNGRAPGTLTRYTTVLSQFTEWASKRNIANVSDVGRAVIVEYVAHLTQRCKLAPATSRYCVRVLLDALKWSGHPVVLRGDDLPAQPHPNPTAYTLEEIEALLAASGEADRLAWELLLTTGMREQELCTLQRRDVDDDAKVIRVRAKTLPDGTPWTPKTRRDRAMPLLPHLLERIQGYTLAPEDYIVQAPTGGREHHLLRRLYDCAQRAGIKDATLHKFRRTYASMLVRGGAGEIVVQNLMGHSGLSMTVRHYIEQLKAEQVQSQSAVASAFARLTTKPQEAQ